jgi:hypothetical protein
LREMQAAKKLVLVDPQFLEQYKSDREYKQILKPADVVGRANLSTDIGNILNDSSESDDRKVKRYLIALNRYLTIKDKVPQETVSASNRLTVEQPPPPPPPKRKSKRKIKKPVWLDY